MGEESVSWERNEFNGDGLCFIGGKQYRISAPWRSNVTRIRGVLLHLAECAEAVVRFMERS